MSVEIGGYLESMLIIRCQLLDLFIENIND